MFTFEDGLEGQQMFGLVTNDLTQIKPNYEAMVKGGTLRVNDEGYAQGNLYLLALYIENTLKFVVRPAVQ